MVLDTRAGHFRDTGVYRHDIEYSFRCDEYDMFSTSFGINCLCAEFIVTLLRKNLELNRDITTHVIRDVAHDFSVDRLVYVLANAVNHRTDDEKISLSNKEWAENINVAPYKFLKNFALNELSSFLINTLVDEVRDVTEGKGYIIYDPEDI